MLVRSLVNAPFRLEKALALSICASISLPVQLLLCSYLRAQYFFLSHEEIAAMIGYLWVSFFVYFVLKLRAMPTTKFVLKYRLAHLYLMKSFSPRRIFLRLLVLVLRARARVVHLRALYASRKMHTLPPADATRASRDSARYKSLVKRHE